MTNDFDPARPNAGARVKSDERRPEGGKREPKKATARYLENFALYYLGRFSASTDRLRRLLRDKVERSARAHGTDRAEGLRTIETLIGRFVASEILDDRRYAAARARARHRQGWSLRRIGGDLHERGIGAEEITAALAALEDESVGEDGHRSIKAALDFRAAAAFARRRRLGPYRSVASRALNRTHDLAALARAGFSYDIARRVLGAADATALEALAKMT